MLKYLHNKRVCKIKLYVLDLIIFIIETLDACICINVSIHEFMYKFVDIQCHIC